MFFIAVQSSMSVDIVAVSFNETTPCHTCLIPFDCSHMTPVIWPATLSITQCLATSYTTSSIWPKPANRPRDMQLDWQLSITTHCCSLSVFTGGGHCPLRPSAGHFSDFWPL